MLLAIAFVAYWPAVHGGFLWDDDVLLTGSPLVHASDGLYRMWLTGQAIDYWPMTGTSFWIEWRLWGLDPVGYHITNVVLHAASALLLCAILRRLAVPGARLAALLFLVHPVNVESVAWIAQRKNTLSMVFFLLSTLWYVADECATRGDDPPGHGWPQALQRGKAARSPARPPNIDPTDGTRRTHWRRWYWLSLGAFAMAMLSKGSVAPLPAMLLLIVWWRRKKLTGVDLLRVVPFVSISAALTVVNVLFQTRRSGGAIRDVTTPERLLGAGGVLWFYLYKALVPIRMVFIYPQWRVRADDVLWWVPLVAAVGTAAVLVRYRRRPAVRALLVAWTFFGLALLPVMGLADVYFMRYSLVADHYAYIALLAVVAGVAAGVSRLWEADARSGLVNERRTSRRIVGGTVCAAVLVGLATATWRLSHHYADAATLYSATLRDNPACGLCEANLAVPLVARGSPADLADAIQHLSAAARMQPGMPEVHIGLGVALQKMGRVDEAIAEYERALALNPISAEARADLVIAREARGLALSEAGDFERAATDFARVLHDDPNRASTHRELGYAWLRLGRPDDAVAHLQEAVRLDPRSADTHDTLATAWRMVHRPDQALAEYREAVRLAPNVAEWHNNFGSALLEADRPDEAAREFREAVRCDPTSARVRRNLGIALAAMNQLEEAAGQLREAVRLDPDDPDARAQLEDVRKRSRGK